MRVSAGAGQTVIDGAMVAFFLPATGAGPPIQLVAGGTDAAGMFTTSLAAGTYQLAVDATGRIERRRIQVPQTGTIEVHFDDA